MYSWIFRHLPGPFLLKVIEAIIIVLAIIWGLFEWVFPLVGEYLNESTL